MAPPPTYLRMSALKETGKGADETAMRRGRWLWSEVGLLPQESEDATEPLGHERRRRRTCEVNTGEGCIDNLLAKDQVRQTGKGAGRWRRRGLEGPGGGRR